MSSWKRWARYAKARLDVALARGEEELDRREARLEAEAADKPWLRSSREAPTLDEVRSRIAHDAREAERRRAEGGDRPAVDPAPDAPPVIDLDLEAQEREADARLEAIRRELGLTGEDSPPR